MSGVLTIDEIKELCDGEWVLVGDPKLDEHDRVVSGNVLAHSKDRDEVYAAMLKLRPKHGATLCFSKVPEDMVIVL